MQQPGLAAPAGDDPARGGADGAHAGRRRGGAARGPHLHDRRPQRTLDRAVQLAEEAHRQLPSRPEVSDTLGWVYYKKGLLPLAIDMMHEAR